MIIEVQNLSFGYGRHPVLSDVSFSTDEGTLMAVLGPNGVGKSTLFRCMLGLLRGYSGTIRINGEDVRSLAPADMAHRVAYIPQAHSGAFNYSVMDMVLMGTAHGVGVFSSPKSREREAAHAALERLGIAALRDKQFSCLSVGEQQLVLIARALAQEVRIFIMDEPTSSLDYGNRARVLERLRQIVAENYTIVVSTHDPQHALLYADSVLALLGGRVEAKGTPNEVVDEALIKRLYGMDVTFVDTAAGLLIAPSGGRCG